MFCVGVGVVVSVVFWYGYRCVCVLGVGAGGKGKNTLINCLTLVMDIIKYVLYRTTNRRQFI